MWGQRKKTVVGKIDTLIGRHTEITGEVRFSGGLHIDGVIKGNVVANGEADAALTLSEHGRIEGEVRVPNIVLNGVVNGDVHASGRVELAAKARITGNVYYNLFEMALGAEVNGNLVHRNPDKTTDESAVETRNPQEDAPSVTPIRIKS